MIYSFLLCFFILDAFSFFQEAETLKRIWLIRHCDKPPQTANPCCTDVGYRRAEAWGDFFHRWIPPEQKIGIYTSNYHEKRQCETPYPIIWDHSPSKSCQKSQRMSYTAVSIYQSIGKWRKTSSLPFLQMNHCIGEYRYLLKEILDRKTEVDDAIIVWEHTEMIEIIRYFDISISKWKKRWRKEYSIVFLIVFDENDNTKYILKYRCFHFQQNNSECSPNIREWLGSFDYLENKFTNHRVNDLKTIQGLYITVFTLLLLIAVILLHMRKRYLFYLEGWRSIP